jgi:uncharacterized protein (TIGR02145 family)
LITVQKHGPGCPGGNEEFMHKRNDNAIKNFLAALVVLVSLSLNGSCSSTKKSEGIRTTVTIESDSVLTDKQGNSYLLKKMSDNLLWMTTNLKLKTKNSFCYDDIESNCEQFGRLYTWEEATRVCNLLGDGWRLPTNSEWMRLAELYAAPATDSIEARKTSYQSLLQGGNVGFNAILGGGRRSSLEFARLQAHGFYWTATSIDSTTACFENFAKGSQSLYHQRDGDKTAAFSVRCVKN